MVCVYCGSKTKVTNSRRQKRNNQIWRRRQCLKCQAVFTSHEVIDLSGALLVDSKPFIEDLLYSDLLLALKDRSDSHEAAREVTHTVVQELLKSPQKPQFTSSEISRVAGAILERLDRRAYFHFHADHPSLQQ